MPNHPERYRTATSRDPLFPSLRIHAGLEDPTSSSPTLRQGLRASMRPADATRRFADQRAGSGHVPGASWGGYEGLIMPNHPERYRTATSRDSSLSSLRIHAGLEDPDELIADLERGFGRLNAAA